MFAVYTPPAELSVDDNKHFDSANWIGFTRTCVGVYMCGVVCLIMYVVIVFAVYMCMCVW